MTVLALSRSPRTASILEPGRLVLADGLVVELGRAGLHRIADLDALFSGMSSPSRWFRFLQGTGRLPARTLTYLADVDQHDHVAWLAYVDGVCVAEARFVRLTHDPSAADLGLAVTDAYQGRGIGRALLQRLVEEAPLHGITRFVATVDAENWRALRLLRSAGMSGGASSGVVDGELVLTAA